MQFVVTAYDGENMLFKDQEQTVICSPEDEIPACTVPESRQQPDDAHVQNLAGHAASVSTERNVNVVPEERRQRNMPTLPEIVY